MTKGRAYPERPIVGVGAVVLHEDRVLLVQRAKPPRQGQWSLPGGAQKLGETLMAAAKREVAEEAGIEIAVAGMIDAIDSIIHDDAGDVEYHYTLFDVAARWVAGDLQPGGDAADARWVPLAELPSYQLWSETHRVIAAAVSILGE